MVHTTKSPFRIFCSIDTVSRGLCFVSVHPHPHYSKRRRRRYPHGDQERFYQGRRVKQHLERTSLPSPLSETSARDFTSGVWFSTIDTSMACHSEVLSNANSIALIRLASRLMDLRVHLLWVQEHRADFLCSSRGLPSQWNPKPSSIPLTLALDHFRNSRGSVAVPRPPSKPFLRRLGSGATLGSRTGSDRRWG